MKVRNHSFEILVYIFLLDVEPQGHCCIFCHNFPFIGIYSDILTKLQEMAKKTNNDQ